MAKLKALAPRLALVPSRLAPPPVNDHSRIRGRALQRIRTQHRYAQPLCVRCLERGIVRAWTQLDHVTALVNGGEESSDPMRNRQGLCDECHDAKTRDDLASRAAR